MHIRNVHCEGVIIVCLSVFEREWKYLQVCVDVCVVCMCVMMCDEMRKCFIHWNLTMACDVCVRVCV